MSDASERGPSSAGIPAAEMEVCESDYTESLSLPEPGAATWFFEEHAPHAAASGYGGSEITGSVYDRAGSSPRSGALDLTGSGDPQSWAPDSSGGRSLSGSSRDDDSVHGSGSEPGERLWGFALGADQGDGFPPEPLHSTRAHEAGSYPASENGVDNNLPADAEPTAQPQNLSAALLETLQAAAPESQAHAPDDRDSRMRSWIEGGGRTIPDLESLLGSLNI